MKKSHTKPFCLKKLIDLRKFIRYTKVSVIEIFFYEESNEFN